MNDPKSTRRRFGRRAIKLGRHGAIASNEASSCEVVFTNDITFKSILLKPDSAPAYNGRGWSEYLKGNFDGAINDATHAIQLDPKDGHAYGTRGWARYGKGDLAGALEDCKKAVELFSKDPVSSAYDQGMVDFINGENQKAIDSWQSAIQRAASLKRELQPWIEKAKARTE